MDAGQRTHQSTNGTMVWAWMLWSAYALGTRRELWFGHGCSGQRTHQNTNGVMVWEWMLWSEYALGTRRELWFEHGCSGQRTHQNTNGTVVWSWMLWSAYALGTRTEIWFEHGCSGQRMLLEHEWNYGLGMDALVSVCSWNTKGIMVWAWMLWSAYALGTRRESWFGHGCSGQRMLLERERNHGLGMDALVSALIKTRTELWFGNGCSGQRDASGTRTNLLALDRSIFCESRKLQKCSIHCQGQQKQAP